ncbi:MAG: sterol desaturase family protein [Pseudomonadota bacterium]|uniref:sterol desaturase family protein n=1 Tax=Hydrogenophaga sp. TaxID=1904254 RepID=UPI000EC27521|nr:MAG: sterol desaturase family protein [Comamonadaceae bacterium]
MKQLAQSILRWGSYPLVFGGSTLAIVYKLYAGMSYWPVVPAISLAGVLAVAVLERGRPFRAAWLTDHGDTNTDIAHTVVNLAVIQLTAVWIARLGDFVPPQWRLFPVQWPLWSQLLLVAAVFDLGLYAVHRLSHAVSWLWRLHAPHHSAERLYWLNGERRHPLHAALMAAPGLTILFAMGTPSELVAAWLAILVVHLTFQHSNLDYSLGPIRHLIGVAETHRWHHKRDFEDAQVNFGEFFMIWDRALGTYFDSRDHLGDAAVGLREKDYPRDYWGQLLHPLKRAASVDVIAPK